MYVHSNSSMFQLFLILVLVSGADALTFSQYLTCWGPCHPASQPGGQRHWTAAPFNFKDSCCEISFYRDEEISGETFRFIFSRTMLIMNYCCRLLYELTHSGSCIDPTAVMISLTLPLPFKLLDGIQLVRNAAMQIYSLLILKEHQNHTGTARVAVCLNNRSGQLPATKSGSMAPTSRKPGLPTFSIL